MTTAKEDIQRKLTAKQAEVLAFIEQNPVLYSPTVREIATAFMYKSPNAVVGHLRALEKKGYIRRRKGAARNIEVLR